MKRALLVIVLLAAALIFSLPHRSLYADDHDRNFAYVGRGLYRILGAVFQVPRYLIYKTVTEPIGLGTLDGAIQGTFFAVTELTKGVLDIGRGVAPYAKYAGLVFL